MKEWEKAMALVKKLAKCVQSAYEKTTFSIHSDRAEWWFSVHFELKLALDVFYQVNEICNRAPGKRMARKLKKLGEDLPRAIRLAFECQDAKGEERSSLRDLNAVISRAGCVIGDVEETLTDGERDALPGTITAWN